MRGTHLFIALAAIWGSVSGGCGGLPSGRDDQLSAVLGSAGTGGVNGTGGTAGGGSPVGPMHGFIRNDGVEGVVYKGIRFGQGAAVEDEQIIGQQSNLHKVSAGPTANTPWGYLRSDGVNAIMYASRDGHVHEVSQKGTNGVWSDADFSVTFGAPASSSEMIFAYVRTDGLNSIIYRAGNGDIIEIYSNFGGSQGWLWGDLTAVINAPKSLDGPVAYLRSDQKNAILYTATDSHVHEIASNFGGSPGWIDTDLFAASGLSLTTSNDAWGYRRFDDINAVVFTQGGVLYELYLPVSGTCFTGHQWCWDILASDATTTSPYRPSAYVRWDNRNAVMYLSASNTANEMSLGAGDTAWLKAVLPLGMGPGGSTLTLTGSSVPFGHRAPGSNNSVLIEGNASSELGANAFELYLPNGGHWATQPIEF